MMKKIVSLFLVLCLLACLLAACKRPGSTQDSTEQTTEGGILLPEEPVVDDGAEATDADSQTDSTEQNGTGAASGQETAGAQESPENPTAGSGTTQTQENTGGSTQGSSGQQNTADTQDNTAASGDSAKVYTITYTGLAGATHSNPATYTAMTANTVILAAPSDRHNYTFIGWYIGDTLVTTLAGCTGDLTLTAKWTSGAISLPVVPFK